MASIDKSHAPRKRFGQNFLHDPHIIQKIVRTIAPQADEHLVEIGPGQAALTEHLVGACQRLDVIEIDRDLAPKLVTRFGDWAGFHLHQGDALKFDFSSLTLQPKGLRVVGNLPYNISSPLIFHLLAQSQWISDMTFMLQKEVVDRMVSGPGGKDYSRLSVMVQYYCRAERCFIVPPGAFFPPPKVDSAIVRLTPHATRALPRDAEITFAALVSACFAQRRKTLRNNLKGLLEVAAIEELGIDPGARAETLPISDFVALTRVLHAHSVLA
jgi:16S rRNA (adenine1518-N6/adenine1519-N6)-dimethyltransferase